MNENVTLKAWEVERYEKLIEINAEMLAVLHRDREALQELVDRQANDEGLWFAAQTAPEEYLQAALRTLHVQIERQ